MTAIEHRARRLRAHDAADATDGVISRERLRDLGIGRQMVSREVAAGRWATLGRATVAVHTGPQSETALRWRAVWEVGAGAALDGVSALHAAGLTGFVSPVVHVSVPDDFRPQPVPGVRLHRVSRHPGEVVGTGIPRVRPAAATLRAAHWASSDRQAALLLCLPVQQRLVTGEGLAAAATVVRGRARRAFVEQVVADVADGAQALGELDFTSLCRRRHLPPPSRQVVVHGACGRIYLDVEWEDLALAVEIDGAGHRTGLAVTADNSRRNRLLIGGRIVLTLDLVGLRLDPDACMGQVEAAIRAIARRAAG